MTVKVSMTATAEIFYEGQTAVVSIHPGQKRSKTNAAPKIVATAMLTKMLKEAILTISSF